MLKTLKNNEVTELKRRLLETKRLFGMLFLLSSWAFSLFPAPAAQAGEAEILILHTNNVTGYLLPCPT
jgi:hypothetical protein